MKFIVEYNGREFRRNLNLTQQELADLIGVSKNVISDFEVGNYLPSIHVSLKLMTVFNCSFDDLFTYYKIFER